MPIDFRSEDSQIVENNAHCSADQCRCQVTIDTLSDDALLYAFDFYVAQSQYVPRSDNMYSEVSVREVEMWHALVHVCQRWRILVFSSPRRLNLRIACTGETRVREKLDVWPALPIVICGYCPSMSSQTSIDKIKAALEHHNRVCQIDLRLYGQSELSEIFAALEAPFPALRHLRLRTSGISYPIHLNPVKFLGGPTYLRSLSFTSIPVPGLLELLLSSANLVNLHLYEIPTNGFISPDAMVTALSTLTRLETLRLSFSRRSRPDWERRRLPPSLSTCTVLHSLIELTFDGVVEYLDDFMARIDAPLLDHLYISIFPGLNDQIIVPSTPQILRFISHASKFQALGEAHIGIKLSAFMVWIRFLSTRTPRGVLYVEIFCCHAERQFPCLAQFCRSPFFPLSTLEHLYLDEGTYYGINRQDGMENTRWLKLLQPFTSVKNLYLHDVFARSIAPVLEELAGEIAKEVLPSLENVFIKNLQLDGPVNEGFCNFAAMRQLSGHPIVVSNWTK